ncbi:MAG TPA: VWA-like domain-containing protein [Ktedonosporobacter sp.]|nr:VWA-like domain-containing protein [Ktedonosporobacter sp.]
MEQSNELQRKISATILQLRRRSPFFATLALFARIHLTETVPTAATDGRDIFINEHFWSTMTRPEQLGVFTHEVLHAALLHVPRRGPRDPWLWNIAADIVVNGMILAQEGFTLPKGHIRAQDLEHLSVEEVYHKLQSQPDRFPMPPMIDLLWPGDLDAQGSLGQKGYAELEQHWRQAMQHAQTLARMLGQGTLPAGLERELPNLSPAQLDWRSYLWRFLVQTPTDFQDYDRRFIGQRLYLDTLAGESVRVYIAVDTSGSIGTREMKLFLSEITGILSAYPHLVALLYYADAACYGPYSLTEKHEIPKPIGGGGTDFRPFFRAIREEQNDYQVGVCVYLTDGYGTFPEQAPSLPVLWVLSPGGISTNTVPFGEAVRLIPDA